MLLKPASRFFRLSMDLFLLLLTLVNLKHYLLPRSIKIWVLLLLLMGPKVLRSQKGLDP